MYLVINKVSFRLTNRYIPGESKDISYWRNRKMKKKNKTKLFRQPCKITNNNNRPRINLNNDR